MRVDRLSSVLLLWLDAFSLEEQRGKVSQVAAPYNPGVRALAGLVGVFDLCGVEKLCKAIRGSEEPVLRSHTEPKEMESLIVLRSVTRKGPEVFGATARYLAYDLGKQKVRVNCISAGPVNTLAARGIAGFNQMMKHYQDRAPLGRSCTLEELGAMGVFLASDGAASITGQTLYVDGGYQIIGM